MKCKCALNTVLVDCDFSSQTGFNNEGKVCPHNKPIAGEWKCEFRKIDTSFQNENIVTSKDEIYLI